MQTKKINGELIEEETKDCKICRNGLVFEDEDKIKTLKFSSDTKQYICTECNRKFTKKLKSARILIGADCLICDNKVYKEELNYLCKCNTDDMTRRILVDADEVKNKVYPDIEKKQNLFRTKGVCEEPHLWIKSKSVKTAEGEFSFESCSICKHGKVNYKGKEYTGQLMRLVDMIARGGVETEQTAKLMENKFKHLETLPKESTDLFPELNVIKSIETELNF